MRARGGVCQENHVAAAAAGSRLDLKENQPDPQLPLAWPVQGMCGIEMRWSRTAEGVNSPKCERINGEQAVDGVGALVQLATNNEEIGDRGKCSGEGEWAHASSGTAARCHLPLLNRQGHVVLVVCRVCWQVQSKGRVAAAAASGSRRQRR